MFERVREFGCPEEFLQTAEHPESRHWRRLKEKYSKTLILQRVRKILVGLWVSQRVSIPLGVPKGFNPLLVGRLVLKAPRISRPGTLP